MAETVKAGWVDLPCGFSVHLEHGVPVRVCNEGRPLPAPTFEQEIAALTGMRVTAGHWEPGELEGDREAPLTVAKEDLGKVLHNLALVSAGLFVDRYGKAIDEHDPDWDDEEFALDFGNALKYCGLNWGDVDQEDYVGAYRKAMHEETGRLASHRGEIITPPE